MKRVFLLVGIITLLYSCKKSTKSNDDETWNEIEVVDKLSDNPIFLKMKKKILRLLMSLLNNRIHF